MKPLPESTPIYKYMALNSFLHFFNNSSIVLSRISTRMESVNSKAGKQYCRISQMYGLISEEL